MRKPFRRHEVAFACLGPLLALAGCASDTEADREPFDRATTLEVPRSPADRDEAATAHALEARRARIADGLTLDQAQAIALEANPQLLSDADAVDAARARISEASVFTNPTFTFAKADFPLETLRGSDTFVQSTRKAEALSFRESQTTWSLQKDLDVSGKRVARVDNALENARQSQAHYVASARSLRAAVHNAFAASLVAERNLDLAREALAMARRNLEIVGGRAAAGNALAADSLRAESEAARAESEVQTAERERDRARRALATLLGAPDASVGTLRGDLPLTPPPEVLDDVALTHEALQQNADVVQAKRAVRAAEANLRLQERAQLPDVTVSLGYNRYFRDPADTANFSIGLPLPVFDQNRGQIAEATALLHQAERQQSVVEQSTEQSVRDDLASIRTSRARIARYEGEILPKTRKAVELTESAFQGGKVLYLDVIAARQTFNQARAEYVNELSSYETALADLERLLGRPLEAKDR